MESKKGFTLVEVLTALSIASVVLLISLPTLSTFRNKRQIAYNARMLKADVNAAKMHAVKVNGYVVCQFYATHYELFIDDGSGGATQGDWKCEGSEKKILKRTLSPSVSLQSNFPQNHMRFRGIGRIRPGTIVIKNVSGTEFALVINALGRARIVER